MADESPTVRRILVLHLTALGCSRQRLKGMLGVSDATLSRDFQAIEKHDRDFGSRPWRLRYLERVAGELRQQIERDEALRN